MKKRINKRSKLTGCEKAGEILKKWKNIFT